MGEERVIIKVSSSVMDKHWIAVQTPNRACKWGKYDFYINDTEIKECDFWIICDDTNEIERVKCDRKNVIFITPEPQSVTHYKSRYLKQFSGVITSNRTLKHRNLFFTQQALTWLIGKTYLIDKNRWSEEFNKDYDNLKQMPQIEKTKLLSVISSDKTFTEGHKARLDFTNMLKDHFKDDIDFYGRGINDFQDKWDVIAPYKYHIAIENSNYPDYFTEKISDCFLAQAFPIYYGCPNLTDYFDEKSFLRIDINKPEEAILLIKKAIDNNLYQERFQYIWESKEKVLDQYNLFPMIVNFIEKNYKTNSLKRKKKFKTIYPRRFKQESTSRKIKRKIKQLFKW